MQAIKSGTNVNITFGPIDNYFVVYINPDNSSLAGWAKVIEFDTAGLGTPNPKGSVDLTDVLNAFKRQGASSVYLSAIGSNFVGGGQISFSINYQGGSVPVSTNLPTWTSQQWAYQLTF